ncbi:hypothetical protein T484DRAFT_1971240 [Baffinella frigidus]|nr:hypothetical protein T484DRAFT_1971240 [Cryptophyta sp. CCMP2293]
MGPPRERRGAGTPPCGTRPPQGRIGPPQNPPAHGMGPPLDPRCGMGPPRERWLQRPTAPTPR